MVTAKRYTIDMGRRADGRGAMLPLLLTIGAVALLSVPLVAMQFTTQVDWTAGDFAIAAALLAAAIVGITLVARSSLRARQRVIAFGAVAAVLMLVWAELAVGVLPG